MRAFPLASLLLLVPYSACGQGESKWGTEISQVTSMATATLYYSDAVTPEQAARVLQAMIDSRFNFGANMPEQVDRIQGRLSLRLGYDNSISTAFLQTDPEDDIFRYFHSLAWRISEATGGEVVDIILCRESLDEAVMTLAWQARA